MPDLDDLALLHEELRDRPVLRRRDLDVHLVRHDLDERLVLLHHLALLHEPLEYLPLGNPFAYVWKLELVLDQWSFSNSRPSSRL